MAEYIEREAAKQTIFDYICEQTVSKYPSSELCRASRMGAEGAMYELDYVPTADVVDVRHGEWVCVNESENVWMCDGKDGCGGEIILLEGTPLENEWNYCPNCGAKMDGKDGAK